jgi:hypothetical protein
VDILKSITGRAGEILRHTSSVLQPLLWLSFLVTIPTLILATFTTHEILRWILVIIGIAPPAAAIKAYFYFSKAGPDRLHSEDYQLRHQTLALIESKGGEIVTDTTSLEVITSPYPSERSREKEVAQ